MCRSGKKGRRPGGGRIQVFQPGDDEWRHFGTIELPMTVEFEDYAGLALDGSRIAIVSQACSGLWIGSLDNSSWTIDGNDEAQGYNLTVHAVPHVEMVEGGAAMMRNPRWRRALQEARRIQRNLRWHAWVLSSIADFATLDPCRVLTPKVEMTYVDFMQGILDDICTSMGLDVAALDRGIWP